MTRTKLFASIAALTLVAGALAAPAIAGGDGEGGHGRGHDKTRPAQTRMRFKLEDHQLALGEAATGQVTLLTRVGKQWGPLAGATLSIVFDAGDGVDCVVPAGEDGGDCIVLDGTDCVTLTTDAEGHATATCTATADGEYVMRVRYAGDETHKRAKRAQGFQVGTDDEEDDDLVPVPEETPTI